MTRQRRAVVMGKHIQHRRPASLLWTLRYHRAIFDAKGIERRHKA